MADNAASCTTCKFVTMHLLHNESSTTNRSKCSLGFSYSCHKGERTDANVQLVGVRDVDLRDFGSELDSDRRDTIGVISSTIWHPSSDHIHLVTEGHHYVHLTHIPCTPCHPTSLPAVAPAAVYGNYEARDERAVQKKKNAVRFGPFGSNSPRTLPCTQSISPSILWTLLLIQRTLTVVRPPTLWNTGYWTVRR